MNRDFTLAKYGELCNTIVQSSYAALSVKDYLSLSLSLQPREKVVILRHDVDKKPEKALKMAEIEREFDIPATYYFRSTKEVFKAEIMQEIERKGHEVGYHYEVLDKAKGNLEEAMKIFEVELKAFRKVCDVKTICMHGNPLSRWTNKDVWDKYDFNNFSLISILVSLIYICVTDIGLVDAYAKLRRTFCELQERDEERELEETEIRR